MDDEEEEDTPIDNYRPKWRDDPIETFSDWTIKIIPNDGSDSSSKLYYVHKTFLAHGPRRSEYFAKLFRSEVCYNENKSSMSEIKLDHYAVEAFPDVLDYLYGSNLNICTESATALHHLGEYFEISRLRLECLKYVHKDLSLHNMHIYYNHAKQLNNEVVMDLVTECLRTYIEDVRSTNPIVQHSTPELWINALGLADDKKWNKRIHVYDTLSLSFVIAKMCKSQSEDTLNAVTFHTLTESLSSIHPSAALDLCALADRFSRIHDDEIETVPSFAILQERCASALSKKWKDLNHWDDIQMETLTQRRPEFLVNLLMKSLRVASQEVNALSTELENSEKLLKAAQRIQWR